MELVALKYIAAGLGAGLVVIGAGLGLGKIGNAALEGIARQPEAGGDIRTSMILTAGCRPEAGKEKQKPIRSFFIAYVSGKCLIMNISSCLSRMKSVLSVIIDCRNLSYLL